MSYTKTYANGYLIRSYYLSAKESDITLIVSEERLNGHKFVLSAKSPVFRTMFFGDFKESNESEVEIKDMNPEAFKVMLKYIYWEELSAKDWPSDDLSFVMDVFKVSHFYHIKPLSTICELKIIGLISVDTMDQVLTFATFYHRKRVLFFLKKFAKKCHKEIEAYKQVK